MPQVGICLDRKSSNYNVRFIRPCRPCAHTDYGLDVLRFPQHAGKSGGVRSTTLWIYYASDLVKEAQEYALMDWSDLLSALGGTLGLFLGLSIYTMGRGAMDTVAECCWCCGGQGKP